MTNQIDKAQAVVDQILAKAGCPKSADMPVGRMNPIVLAEIIAESDLIYPDEVFKELDARGPDGKPLYGLTDAAVGVVGRAVRTDPTLYAKLYPGRRH